jgi:hypothetical protein
MSGRAIGDDGLTQISLGGVQDLIWGFRSGMIDLSNFKPHSSKLHDVILCQLASSFVINFICKHFIGHEFIHYPNLFLRVLQHVTLCKISGMVQPVLATLIRY